MDEFETMRGVTVFAPENAAYDTIQPPSYMRKLREDLPRLRNHLAGHVVTGTLQTDAIKGMRKIPTRAQPDVMEAKLSNEMPEKERRELLRPMPDQLGVTLSDGGIVVGSARLTRTDLEAGGCVLHVVDAALQPHFNPRLKARSGDLWGLPDKLRR
jgi:uncharacterized surface protein with fasciclin (FAS1) repeats